MSSALYFISYKGVASFVSGLPGAFLGCCIYIRYSSKRDCEMNVKLQPYRSGEKTPEMCVVR